MTDPTWLEEAEVYFRKGYEAQMQGNLDEAIAHYLRSIQLCPTAEAHTFLGWAYSSQGKPEEAIRECQIAIRIDPDFGNPYNDIGAYLIEQGQLVEALSWLEKATRAPRYDSYCFPWYNMGRVHERRHDWVKARECYERALQENADYQAAKVALRKLAIMWN